MNNYERDSFRASFEWLSRSAAMRLLNRHELALSAGRLRLLILGGNRSLVFRANESHQLHLLFDVSPLVAYRSRSLGDASGQRRVDLPSLLDIPLFRRHATVVTVKGLIRHTADIAGGMESTVSRSRKEETLIALSQVFVLATGVDEPAEEALHDVIGVVVKGLEPLARAVG